MQSRKYNAELLKVLAFYIYLDNKTFQCAELFVSWEELTRLQVTEGGPTGHIYNMW